MDRKRLGKAIENVDGRVFFPTLKTADIGAVNSRIEGKPFLREAAPHADSS